MAQAQTESEDSISDLLVCLGQEERKVEVLRERLEGLGVDVDALLENIADPDESHEGEDLT